MPSASLAALNFAPQVPIANANTAGSANRAPLIGPPERATDAFTRGDTQVDALAYRRQTQRIAFEASFAQAAAGVSANGEEAGAAAVARQLEFSFAREVRVEELFAFQQRSAQVGDGLEGESASRYAALSREVSARFDVSLTISGAALAGLNRSAESLAGQDDALGDVLAFAQELLGRTEEAFNEFFGTLGDFFSGTSDAEQPFRAAFEALFTELRELFGAFGGGDNAEAASGANAAQGTRAFAASAQLEFSFEFSASVSVEAGEVQESDPIILDLDGDGFDLTSYQQGAQFDITATGQVAQTAFVTGGDAFLALDRDNNGRIDDGAELFGDQRGAANGFEELRRLDANGEGRIDRRDPQFDALRLFADNGNGITEAGELRTLAQAGIREISLNYENVDLRAAGGNRIAQLATYTREDGSRGQAGDAILNYVV